MADYTDPTHNAQLQSWVESANEPATDFPIQNLPLGVFSYDNKRDRIGVAIGDQVLDLRRCVKQDVLKHLDAKSQKALLRETLNAFAALGSGAHRQLRKTLVDVLSIDKGAHAKGQAALVPMADVAMRVPFDIGDYTDFYASISHATNVGSMFRPDNALLPNYKHVPIGYHGRASSIVIDGTPIHRPMGQLRPDDNAPPVFDAVKLLDYEMEVGFFVGQGNGLGTRITMADAPQHIFGLVLVNDWSARDVQKWEYQPLGPFNAKNFGTTLSPWVVTLAALAPFREPGPQRRSDDPQPLDYLKSTEDCGLNITVEVSIRSQTMRERHMPAHIISTGNFREMYWTIAQMLVHHTSTGCNLQPGDLMASGTVSNESENSRGCLLERTWRGEHPIELPDGTQRKFVADGDEVIMRGWCERDGYRRIGFGTCRGIIQPVQ